MATETFTVQRSTHINAPLQRVYDQIVGFHNWTRWSPWDEMDPDMQRTYEGAVSGVGAVYRWSGNRKVGRGAMKITRVVEPSTAEIDLNFEKPFKARNDTVFSVEPDGSGAHVTWSMTGKKTLLTKVMGVFKSMDQMIGPDFEKGLARLRVVSEEPLNRWMCWLAGRAGGGCAREPEVRLLFLV